MPSFTTTSGKLEWVDAESAYKRGWNACRYHDDGKKAFDKARARFAKKYGEGLATAWEEGWCDAAST